VTVVVALSQHPSQQADGFLSVEDGEKIWPQKSPFLEPLPSTALQNSQFLVIIGPYIRR
jgi:hypothetical protein